MVIGGNTLIFDPVLNIFSLAVIRLQWHSLRGFVKQRFLRLEQHKNGDNDLGERCENDCTAVLFTDP